MRSIRSVDVYRTLFREAGLSRVDTRRNYAYTYMEIAVELVELRRRYLRMLPHTSPFSWSFDLVVATGYVSRMLRASSPSGGVAWCALAKAPGPLFYARECKLTLWQIQRDLRETRSMESHDQ